MVIAQLTGLLDTNIQIQSMAVRALRPERDRSQAGQIESRLSGGEPTGLNRPGP